MAAIMRWLLVVLWMSGLFVLSSLPSWHLPLALSSGVLLTTVAYIGGFAVLTLLLGWALQTYAGSGVRVWLIAALVSCGYALSDEWYESWVAMHQSAWGEVGLDVLGIAASYALAHHQPFEALTRIAGGTSRWQCPACQDIRVYRSRRRGVLEWFSRLIRLAPFRCYTCNHRFWRFTLRGR
jgi:hypothetical protein